MTKTLVSASQIKTFRACRRKWAADKIDRLPRTQTQAQADGTRYHAELESWILKGQQPSKIPSQATHHLRVFRDKLEVEQRFDLRLTDDIDLIGYIDVRTKEPSHVWDWKFVKDLRYAMSPEELRNDVQAQAYAWAEHQRGASWVYLKWVYVSKSGRGTQAVEWYAPDGAIETAKQEIVETAKEIRNAKLNVLTMLDLPMPADNGVCGAYGGCEHKPICYGENPEMTLKEKLAAKKAAAQAAAGQSKQEESPAAPRVAGVGAPASGGSLADRLKARKAAAAKPAPEPETLEEAAGVIETEPEPETLEEAAGVIETEPDKGGTLARPMGDITLLIDAVPVKGRKFVQVSTCFSEAYEQVAEANGVEHYSLIEYGKGRGMLDKALTVCLSEVTGGLDVMIDSTNADERDAIPALSRAAATIIRGIR